MWDSTILFSNHRIHLLKLISVFTDIMESFGGHKWCEWFSRNGLTTHDEAFRQNTRLPWITIVYRVVRFSTRQSGFIPTRANLWCKRKRNSRDEPVDYVTARNYVCVKILYLCILYLNSGYDERKETNEWIAEFKWNKIFEIRIIVMQSENTFLTRLPGVTLPKDIVTDRLLS